MKLLRSVEHSPFPRLPPTKQERKRRTRILDPLHTPARRPKQKSHQL